LERIASVSLEVGAATKAAVSKSVSASPLPWSVLGGSIGTTLFPWRRNAGTQRSWSHRPVGAGSSARGSFHLTAGIITNPLTIDGVGKPTNGTMIINNVQYTQAQVGTLNATIKYASALPYLGLGWGTPASKDGGFGFLFDIGAAIGKPTVAMSSTGSAPGLAANIAAQQATTQNDANKLPVWPVISLGFVWRF
jgi:hypothetical protein